jgi:glycosyltransferase involved in cell wall biosynthesis
MVSVLMPVLDGERTIALALESVFSDDRVPVEVLVVDDGSTDGTVSLIEELNDPRIKLLSTGGHRLGANAGRNVGLDAASGEWIAFLDPDDTWLPERLHTLLDVATQTGADWVADDILVVYIDSEDRVQEVSTVFTQRGLEVNGTRELTLENLVRYDLGVLQPLIRRSLLEDPKIRFPKPVTSDFEFSFWSLEAASRATVIQPALYRYNKAQAHKTLSHASPAFWLDSVQSTADLLQTTQGHDPRVVRALEKRLRGSMRRYEYLQARVELRERRVSTAMGRMIRNPSILAVLAESASRRIGKALLRTGEDDDNRV